MKFIRVKSTNGKEHYINVIHIIRISKSATGTYLSLIDDKSISTKLPYEEVIELIENKNSIFNTEDFVC